ncbi:hydroxymethylglutaryl-CoA lyase [Geosporobacter subterraneus DSM 17957]|uniref:Hydroxymethylglutaryl-CoA lyase n=1 Tax=Geosporobacter subterraneus DSM 17957 TaxID=1121919 RepID=A0A1M6KC82_9FIRM|nr:hydroxymethylglutaryl-CoA lyase [Geosporobacter subterraneus]SHJ56530.1 hydroxymethylglutaryl-CoA lyase [Geosporobacter subterraneus DSM 17957]
MVFNQLKDGVKWPSSIQVCEVGPRDGLQNEKTLLTVEQKVELIERSVQAGVKIIEIGSFVHPKAVPPMADTDAVARRLKRVEGVEYRALVLNIKGLERAEAAGIRKAKLTVSASRAHSLSNLNKTPEEAVRGFTESAEYAASRGMVLSGAISTAFGCPFEGKVSLEQVLSVVECFREIGVKELSLSDTTGMANPQQVYEYGLRVKEQFPDVTWNLHFHNTRGMGLANVVAGMMAGIDRYDACFAGLGGCPFAPGASGNIATEDLIHMCHEMGIETGIDLDQVISIGRYVQELIGHDTSSFILKAGKCSDIVKA